MYGVFVEVYTNSLNSLILIAIHFFFQTVHAVNWNGYYLRDIIRTIFSNAIITQCNSPKKQNDHRMIRCWQILKKNGSIFHVTWQHLEPCSNQHRRTNIQWNYPFSFTFSSIKYAFVFLSFLKVSFVLIILLHFCIFI